MDEPVRDEPRLGLGDALERLKLDDVADLVLAERQVRMRQKNGDSVNAFVLFRLDVDLEMRVDILTIS